MTHECKKAEVIEIMREEAKETKSDIKEIKSDVKILLASKNKMDGGLLVIMFLISSAVAVIAKLV